MAKALAACFTPDGELVDETGRREAGRAAIAARAGAFFRARPGATLRSEEDSFRFVGAEAAEQEGTVVVLDREGAVISRSRYGILYVRHEGEWLMASVRDLAMPGGGLTPRERLGEIAWLEGTWVDEARRTVLEVAWSEDGPWLLLTVTHLDGERVAGRGKHRVGWDPLRRAIRSWSWDHTGGYADATWTRTAEGWRIQSRGVTRTGEFGTALHRLVPAGEKAFRWVVLEQAVGERSLPEGAALFVRAKKEEK
jgi:uncharacterized protein (TIGR02246 family)